MRAPSSEVRSAPAYLKIPVRMSLKEGVTSSVTIAPRSTAYASTMPPRVSAMPSASAPAGFIGAVAPAFGIVSSD